MRLDTGDPTVQLGRYADGRPLNFVPSAGAFDVGGTPVPLDAMLAYDAAGQLHWASADARRLSLKPYDSTPLSRNEYIMFILLFALLPGACVLVSSILYYVWRRDRPIRARQINQLGFIIFFINVVVFGLQFAGAL